MFPSDLQYLRDLRDPERPSERPLKPRRGAGLRDLRDLFRARTYSCNRFSHIFQNRSLRSLRSLRGLIRIGFFRRDLGPPGLSGLSPRNAADRTAAASASVFGSSRRGSGCGRVGRSSLACSGIKFWFRSRALCSARFRSAFYAQQPCRSAGRRSRLCVVLSHRLGLPSRHFHADALTEIRGWPGGDQVRGARVGAGSAGQARDAFAVRWPCENSGCWIWV